MIVGIRIGHFLPIPGLTRMETLQREAIRHALILCRRHNRLGRVIQNSHCHAGAAVYLGIGRETLSRKLRLYARKGCPIVRHDGGARKVPPLRLGRAFAQLGMSFPKRLWFRSAEDQRDLLKQANRARLERIAIEHPDRGGNTERAAQINEAWRRVRTIFKRHGVEL